MRRKESKIFSVGYHTHNKIELILTNPRPWEAPFGRINVLTMSLSTSMSLRRIEKERTRVDLKRMDSILFLARITGRMESLFS
jgi:hypothetical protein